MERTLALLLGVRNGLGMCGADNDVSCVCALWLFFFFGECCVHLHTLVLFSSVVNKRVAVLQ